MEIFAGRKRIASKVALCDNLLTQVMGLMFRREPLAKGEAYFFTIGGPIHMAFVKFPIDVVWLDGSMKVVDVQRAEPGPGIYYPNENSSYLLEMAAGAAKGLKIGTQLRLKNA